MKEPISDTEVRNRLEGIAKYNAYFAREVDEKGNPLTQHIVGPRQLWNIMTREWGVDPRQFGIAEPEMAEWPPKDKGAKQEVATEGADPGW